MPRSGPPQGHVRSLNLQLARRDDAVQVWMEGEGLSSGMQNRQSTDLLAEVLRIGGDHQQNLACGSEQDVVELARSGQSEGIQRLGDGEHNVEVREGSVKLGRS